MHSQIVTVEYVDDGAVAVMRLNRPEALNALNPQLAEDFGRVLDELEGRAGLRAVVLTGNGKAFCAGGDLAAFQQLIEAGQPLGSLAIQFHRSILRLRALAAPFVAAINGPCFGVGLSLACACDFRIAADSAKFSVAFTGVALSPDSGLPWFLPRIVGLGVATELAMLNPIIDAKRAQAINLIMAASAGDVVEEALQLARWLAMMPTKALGTVKRLYDAAYTDPLATHLDKEAQWMGDNALTADFQEGAKAFFERRKPVFRGE